MTIDELRELAKDINPDTDSLLKKVVGILGTLRELDIDEIDRFIVIQDLAITKMPPQLIPAFMAMKSDLTLIKAFSEQAKAYDHTEEGIRSFEKVFGEIT